jgi:nucleoredoxin
MAAELLGEKLLTKDGEMSTAHVLEGKVVGIYVSAHWCPPCRGFTPQLAEWYTKDLKAKGLEIVFVSSDRDEDSFNSYYAEMPWLAVPYADRDLKAKLSKKFKVNGIPSFVLIDKDGKTITTEGRDAISSDPTGAKFPWIPKSIPELLDTTYTGKDGPVARDALNDKVIAIYFSAHWCPPCRGFTPKLIEQYKKMKEAGLPIEIIFASSDRDQASFDDYYKDMPWLALPYENRERKEELSSRFGVSGIPSLVLLYKDLSVITTSGRVAIMGDLADFPFHPKPVSDLATGADGLNETVSVIILADGADAKAQDDAIAAMEPLAKEYKAAAKASGEDPEVIFFIAKSAEGPVGQIRKLCKLPDATSTPQLILLDIPDNGGFYLPEASLTTDGLRGMLQDHKNGKLERKQLG